MLDWLIALDVTLYDWVLGLPHPPWLTWIMVALTLAGRGGAVWVLLGLYRVVRHRADGPAFFRLVLALLVTFVLVDGVLKPLVARARPPWPGLVADTLLSPPTSYSFPSGHAASSVAGAFALARFWPRAAAALWMLAALVALSRVYLGMHYPLDVVAGGVVGGLVAVLVTGLAPTPGDSAVEPSEPHRSG